MLVLTVFSFEPESKKEIFTSNGGKINHNPEVIYSNQKILEYKYKKVARAVSPTLYPIAEMIVALFDSIIAIVALTKPNNIFFTSGKNFKIVELFKKL